MAFNIMSGVLTQQLAVHQGITDPQRQNFYLLFGAMMGSSPVGMGAAVVLARQEAEHTVFDSPPALASITPSTAAPGSQTDVVIQGTDFRFGATVKALNPNIAVTNTKVLDDKHITATFVIATAATLGSVDVSVASSNGISKVIPFAIQVPSQIPPVPTLANITPAAGAPGTNVPVTLTGTNFIAGSTVNVANNSITVATPAVVNATTITATFNIDKAAVPGNTTVTITSSAGTSSAATFTVQGAAGGPPNK